MGFQWDSEIDFAITSLGAVLKHKKFQAMHPGEQQKLREAYGILCGWNMVD